MTCPWSGSDPVADAQRGDHKARLPLSKRAMWCRMKKSSRKELGNWRGSAEPAVLATRICRKTFANPMGLYGSQSNIQLLNEEDRGPELTRETACHETAPLSSFPPHVLMLFVEHHFAGTSTGKKRAAFFFLPWVAGSVFETLE